MGRKKKIENDSPFRTRTVRITDKDDNVVDSDQGYVPAVFAPTKYDIEDEVSNMDSFRYGRNFDDKMGGVGLNYGDW